MKQSLNILRCYCCAATTEAKYLSALLLVVIASVAIVLLAGDTCDVELLRVFLVSLCVIAFLYVSLVWACCLPLRRRHSAGAQTESQLMVEFEPGRQCALQVVFVVDSSFSIGPEIFDDVVKFVDTLVHEFEMPAVQVGLIRFHHTYSVRSPITGDREAFVQSLLTMPYEPGETKISPALEHTVTMFQVMAVEPCRKAVVLITDGDTPDIAASLKQAANLKEQHSIDVFCVHIGSSAEQDMLHQLVSSPPEQHLFTLNLYNEWKKVSEALLKNLVFVSRRAKRAKCKVNLSDFETVTDLSIVEGRDLLVPGWESRGPNLWCWEPGHNQCLETHEILWAPELSILKALAFEPFRDQASQATPEQEPPLQVASQTDPIMPEITEMTTQITQTDPLMRVRVGDRRQAPLDLVICVDSSASLCMSKEALPTYHSEGGAFVSSGAFESVKGLLEYLAHAMHMPEVRLGLVRFEDSPQVICPLTGQRDTFLSHLRCMKMSTGETRLAPALHLALQMLEDERKCVRANRADWELPREEKAIVVITDGDANDMAQSMEMATVVKEKDCQLLFIKMGAEQDNLHQMSHAPRRVHSLHKGGAAEYAGTARGVFHSATTNLQDLVSLVPDIQRQLLRSARRIEQARCTLQLGFHEVVVVEDLSHTTGHDVLLENDPAPLLLDHTPWVHTESFAYGTRHEITIKRDELQEAKEICTTLRANFVQTDLTDAKERELEHVKRVLVQRADDIRRLNEELQTLKDGISQRDNTIHRLRDEIGSFQTMPREDDSRISSLKSSLHHAEEELDKMQSEARIMRNTLQETRETSEAKLHHAEEELDKMRSEARIMRNTLQETREASEARQHEVQRLQTKIDHLSLKEEKANSRERSRDWLQEVEQLRTSLREVTNQKIKEEQLHNLTKQRLEEERSQNKEIQSVVDKLMAFLCTAMQHPQSTLELQQQQPRQRPQSARPGGRPSSAHEGARIELNQLRARLEAHHGDLVRAFHDIDDNRTGEITATEMIKGLGTLGLTRSEAQLAFRRLCSLSNSQRKGSLKLSSWLGAFDAKHAASGSLQASLELPGSIG